MQRLEEKVAIEFRDAVGIGDFSNWMKGFRSGALAGAIALIGLSPAAAQSPGLPPSSHIQAPHAEPIPLGMPIRKVMNAIIDFWAFGVLFLSETKTNLSDDDWRSLELASLNLTIAATAITVPGSGPNDERWVKDKDWQRWAKQMRDAATMLDVAVQERNRTSLHAAANRLADACLACHTTFKPKSAPRSLAQLQ